jgi:hypothetical protein
LLRHKLRLCPDEEHDIDAFERIGRKHPFILNPLHALRKCLSQPYFRCPEKETPKRSHRAGDHEVVERQIPKQRHCYRYKLLSIDTITSILNSLVSRKNVCVPRLKIVSERVRGGLLIISWLQRRLHNNA